MVSEVIKGWVTTDQAAALTGYDPAYIRALAKRGRIDGFKVGRDWLVSKTDVLAYKRRMDDLGRQKHNPWRGRR